MNTTAQLDMTGSKPDSNGLEDCQCPFHGGGADPTAILDHVRGAFLCFACKAMGAFSVQIANGKRIVLMIFQSYRK